jgi:hypothetical protein
MAELKLGRVQLWQVVEFGVIPRGEVDHGVFTAEAEAWARYDAVLRQQPGLGVTGSLQVRPRSVEVVEPVAEPKMRRVGKDYEDKAAEGARR